MLNVEYNVGDWVYSSFSDKPCRIIGIKLLDGDYADVKVEGVEGWKDINSLTPIPLNSEILEKNGFLLYKEEDKAYRWEYADGIYINIDFKVDEPFVAIHNRCYYAVPVCNYVHQLQHAIRLCNIDKQIIL